MKRYKISFVVEGTRVANDVPLDDETVRTSVEVGFCPTDILGEQEGDCKISELHVIEVKE